MRKSGCSGWRETTLIPESSWTSKNFPSGLNRVRLMSLRNAGVKAFFDYQSGQGLFAAETGVTHHARLPLAKLSNVIDLVAATHSAGRVFRFLSISRNRFCSGLVRPKRSAKKPPVFPLSS